MLGRLTDADGVPAGLQPAFLRACVRQRLLLGTSRRRRQHRRGDRLERALIDGLVDRQDAPQPRRSTSSRPSASPAPCAIACRPTTGASSTGCCSCSRADRARPLDLDDALELIDDALVSLVAVGGLEMAHMTRDDGWRFLSLGRHLERLHFVATHARRRRAGSGVGRIRRCSNGCSSCRTACSPTASRYMQQPEWQSVVDLMLFDERNPRSARFQLAKLAKHVRLLPDAGADRRAGGGRAAARRLPRRRRRRPGRVVRRRRAAARGAADRLSARRRAPRIRALRCATSATSTTCRGRRSAYERRALYRIEHETRYVHARRRVDVAARRVPDAARRCRVSACAWHELAIEPAPASRAQRIDYFGNAVDQFTILTPYDEMRVVGRSVVEVTRAPDRRSTPTPSAPWEAVRDALVYQRGAPYDDAVGVQLSVAVRRHGPGAGRVRARVVRRRSGRWSRRRST